MLVKDIYGGDYEWGLLGDLPASSFGKCINIKTEKDLNSFQDKDIARGLLDMISMNIAQIAYLVALNNKCNRILFAGNFLRGNDIAQTTITFGLNYRSNSQMTAYFLKHEGYFGAFGAMLNHKIHLKNVNKTSIKSKSKL